MQLFREAEIVNINELEAANSTEAAGLLRSRIQANTEVLVVANLDRVQWLPAIALSLQTRMIRVKHYVVGHELPLIFNSTWPDAPITFYSADLDALETARLRGWNTVEASTSSIEEVTSAIYSEI
jgi:hypothetical protein